MTRRDKMLLALLELLEPGKTRTVSAPLHEMQFGQMFPEEPPMSRFESANIYLDALEEGLIS